MVEIDEILPKACEILGTSCLDDLVIKSIKRGGSGRQISRISLTPEAKLETLTKYDQDDSTAPPESIISMVYSCLLYTSDAADD